MQLKKTLFKPTLVLLIIIAWLPAVAQQKISVKQLELKTSKILWKAPKNHGGSKHFGYLQFNSGSLNFSPAGAPLYAFFSINMNSIVSTDSDNPVNNKKVADQVKGKEFFDVAHYPTGSMMVQKITATKTPFIYLVAGDLTIKDIKKPIEFKATIKTTAAGTLVTGNLTIDRNQWNIKQTSGNFFSVIKDELISEDIPIGLQLLFK